MVVNGNYGLMPMEGLNTMAVAMPGVAVALTTITPWSPAVTVALPDGEQGAGTSTPTMPV